MQKSARNPKDKHIGTIWFGFVQGLAEEEGPFSDIELKETKAWEIPSRNLHYAGKRHNRSIER